MTDILPARVPRPLDEWPPAGMREAAHRTWSVREVVEHRLQVPDDSGLDMIEPFMGMLITLSAFDLGQERLPDFASYRFLYERLLGASSRTLTGGAGFHPQWRLGHLQKRLDCTQEPKSQHQCLDEHCCDRRGADRAVA